MRTRLGAILSLRIDEGVKAALQRRADADQRPLAAYVQLVLKAHVEDTPEPVLRKSRKA